LITTPLNTAHIINAEADHPVTELNWWESQDLNPHTRVYCVPARHWTSRKPGDENTSLWGGFVVRFASGSIYFAGDTGYGDGEHFRQPMSRAGL
jgi:L-ascorbate metabolism protein UlaG (beta-lactamase superfamily)